MESEIYASSIGSTSNAIAIPIVSSSNYETRSSSSRRNHQTKKRSHDVNSTENLDERIEVKILPQDDNWGETTTITCHGGNEETLTNTNETSLQINENPPNCADQNRNSTKRFSRDKSTLSLSNFLVYLLCFIAFISPIFFLTLPSILNSSESIPIDDYSKILTLIFKEILLFIGTFSLLYRRRNYSFLPRIHLQKFLLIVILTLIIVSFWSFYIWKIWHVEKAKYEGILSLTSMYEDLLLFLLIIAVFLLEVKWIYPRWIVKVVRSPDGQTRQYTIGSMSIQEAATYLLEQYYKDFPVFNPWLENAQQTQARRVAGAFSTKSIGSQSNSSTVNGTENGGTARSMRGFNDRFYDELDYERRVRKRRTKLLSSCEDAFNHVRKCLNEKTGSHVPMDSREAAQAVFSSMSRSLQKYLRLTRQQPYFTRESIISHLATCLSHDLSPRTFLERYVQTDCQPLATLLFPALASTNAHEEQSWTLVCDIDDEQRRHEYFPINQTIRSNLIFVLKQQHAEHIALVCSFHPIPKVNLIERLFDSKQNKFVLKLNSETSV
uniref:Strabismus n=1 Tax=Philodina roseola TaxID=96448 RepID=B2L3L0_PHIRO|nr:Strabismus [Philodina roseola]